MSLQQKAPAFWKTIAMSGRRLELVNSGDRIILHATANVHTGNALDRPAPPQQKVDLFFTFDLCDHDDRTFLDDLAVRIYDLLSLSALKQKPHEQQPLLPEAPQ